MPADELKQAAQIHRRWRGLGAVLFVAFYSFFFSLHLKLEKTSYYVHNEAMVRPGMGFFFNDLVLPGEHAGAGGTGRGSAFLLLHHPPARLLTALWKPFTDQSSSRKHAVASLTASAGALTVVLLYLTLMWSGVGRLRAALLAGIFGGSAAMILIAGVPDRAVFQALGLTAVLAAVARGRSGRWWEFPLAAGYALCCHPLNAVPVALMGAVGWACALRGCRGVRPVFGLLGGAVILGLLVFGMMTLQEWFYPRTATAMPDLLEGWRQAFIRAGTLTARADKFQMVSDSVIGLLVRPMEGSTIRQGIAQGWAVMVVVALIGLVGATKQRPVPIVAALLAWGWCIWFYGGSPSERLQFSSVSVPFLVYLVGIGMEQNVKGWTWLRWPATCLLAAFLMILFWHNRSLLDLFHRVPKVGVSAT